MKSGCYTAIVTPFKGERLDNQGLERLIDFQLSEGVTGILAVGTTGESPCLSWEEHNRVIETLINRAGGRCICIASEGSNNTRESLEGIKHAAKTGANAILLIDPYYNGPSSLEIRREYIEPASKLFPNLTIIPCVIPSRTGTQLFPEDLAILHKRYKNVNTVKEATGNIENIRKTRNLCGSDFTILSGDDQITFDMMTDPTINGNGVISVLSNIIPGQMTAMVKYLEEQDIKKAEDIASAVEPLLKIINVVTQEETEYGNVICKARSPLPIKTLMSILNMPSGGCRRPTGKMTEKGFNKVLEAAKSVNDANPQILKPIADFFRVDIEHRLSDPECWKELYYEEY